MLTLVIRGGNKLLLAGQVGPSQETSRRKPFIFKCPVAAGRRPAWFLGVCLLFLVKFQVQSSVTSSNAGELEWRTEERKTSRDLSRGLVRGLFVEALVAAEELDSSSWEICMKIEKNARPLERTGEPNQRIDWIEFSVSVSVQLPCLSLRFESANSIRYKELT